MEGEKVEGIEDKGRDFVGVARQREWKGNVWWGEEGVRECGGVSSVWDCEVCIRERKGREGKGREGKGREGWVCSEVKGATATLPSHSLHPHTAHSTLPRIAASPGTA